jgi:outer membrane protein TolC
MKNIYFWMAMIFCILPVYGQAPEAQQSLNPEMAVEMAIRNNLNLEAARIGLDIRKRRSNLAWNQFLPSATVTGTLLRDNVAATSQGFDPSTMRPIMITVPQWHMNGAFTATLDFSFALFEGVRSLRLDYEAGLLSLERAKLQMEQGVRKMYNSILLLEANVDLLKESFTNAQRQADIAEANFRAGLVPRLTWLQAQVAVENMRPTVSNLENSLKTLMGNFALLLGLPFDTSFELESLSFGESDIPIVMDELIFRAVSQKPDIMELQASIQALQSQYKALSLQQFTPFLRLGWNLSYLFNPMLDPFSDNLFTGDNWNRGGNFSITLGMNFNSLFPFTREGQQRRDIDSNLQIQGIRLAQMIRETELEVFTKLASLENVMATVEAQRGAVQLAQESYRLTEEAYRAGLQDFQAVQGAALALDQARLQLLTQQFNFLNDLIDLEYAIGVPFGTLSSDRTLSSTGSVR